MADRKRTTARAAVLPARRGRLDVRRIAPSGRSIAAGLALLTLAVAAYLAARETSMFAVQRIEVEGASPRVRDEVAAALAAVRGRSLVRIDAAEVDRRLARVPDVLSATFDRSFPHTLRVAVTPERPVLLLRRGADGWVISARGRVLRHVRTTRRSPLPRLWVPRARAITMGATLASADGGAAAAALAPAAAHALPGGVRFVRTGAHALTFVLRSGLEVRLGDPGDLRLKLAIARRIVLAIGADAGGYVDVSVPERPVVASADPRVEGRG